MSLTIKPADLDQYVRIGTTETVYVGDDVVDHYVEPSEFDAYARCRTKTTALEAMSTAFAKVMQNPEDHTRYVNETDGSGRDVYGLHPADSVMYFFSEAYGLGFSFDEDLRIKCVAHMGDLMSIATFGRFVFNLPTSIPQQASVNIKADFMIGGTPGIILFGPKGEYDGWFNSWGWKALCLACEVDVCYLLFIKQHRDGMPDPDGIVLTELFLPEGTADYFNSTVIDTVAMIHTLGLSEFFN